MQWFENENFWRTLYPYMFNEDRLAAAPGDVDRVLTLSRVQHGAVLDLCCGPGRHSVVLADKGFEVTGVDRSPFLLSKAQARAAGRRIELIEADMRDFVRLGAFDLALSLFTSFGYFESRDHDLGVLRNIRTSLKNGGVFLIDVIGKEYLASRGCATQWKQWADGNILIQHCDILPGWARVHNQWLLVRQDHAQSFEFEHNLYSGQELSDLLEKAGFAEIQLFGSLDGTPYDSTATRLLARARV